MAKELSIDLVLRDSQMRLSETVTLAIDIRDEKDIVNAVKYAASKLMKNIDSIK